MIRYKNEHSLTGFEVAIIGMSCRLPEANTIDEFWKNLINERESITFFDKEELAKSLPSVFQVNSKNYIPACGYMSQPDYFDGAFFDFSNKESQLLDPQVRVFLECAWQALEDSGYSDKMDSHRTGIFGTASDNLLWQMATSNSSDKMMSEFYQASILNNKDFLSTIAAYKLNLKGTSLNISSACSSSLVAIHMACQNLLSGAIDIALAGGVCVNFPFKQGYVYQDGMILSSDGHCRAFDQNASGTVGGNGCGVVALKLLDQAMKDNDPIYAVIKGSAVNNDGVRKVGFTAPSIDGQSEAIKEAQFVAEVPSESIGYVEAHGTGTRVGDQIEIEALKKVFHKNEKHSCAIGSVKTNIGHLDTASGVVGLMKATLALKNKKLPKSLNCDKENEAIGFKDSPFYVNTTTSDFIPIGNYPLRAGVSSFGISGTNAHIVLEEAPEEIRHVTKETEDEMQFVLLSAKTEASLQGIASSYKDYFENNDVNLADAANTTRVARKHFPMRRCILSNRMQDVIEDLGSNDVISGYTEIKYLDKKKIYFIFQSREESEEANYLNQLKEFADFDSVTITKEDWDEVSSRIKEEQNEVSIIVEISDVASLQFGMDQLISKNDHLEYIFLHHTKEKLSEKSFVYKTIARLWEHGVEIFWDKLYEGKEYYTISLPTYVFDRKQYELKLDLNAFSMNVEEEFNSAVLYDYNFRKCEIKDLLPEGLTGKSIVIFSDEDKLSEELEKSLKSLNRELIVVARGNQFLKKNDHLYTIRENNFEDYIQLITLFETQNRDVLTYMHCYSIDDAMKNSVTQDSAILSNSYYSLVHLAKALAYIETLNREEKKLFVITNNLQSVGGNEEITYMHSDILGLIRTVSTEYELVQVKSIDFDLLSGKRNYELIANQIKSEMLSQDTVGMVAYRGKKRYVEDFKPLDCEVSNPYSEAIGKNLLFCGGDSLSEKELAPLYPMLSNDQLTVVANGKLKDETGIEHLKNLGVDVSVIECDFYQGEQLASLLNTVSNETINGIFCVDLVKEDDYHCCLIESHEIDLERAYVDRKWSFVSSLYQQVKTLDYQFVLFLLPGSLQIGKAANFLPNSLVSAIYGLCRYAENETAKRWISYMYFEDSNVSESSQIALPVDSTEISQSNTNPIELLKKHKMKYTELFEEFVGYKHDITDSLYRVIWKNQENLSISVSLSEKSCMLFVGNGTKGQIIEEAFTKIFKNLVIVHEGKAFAKSSKNTYIIDRENVEDYYKVFDDIRDEIAQPDIIIQAFGFNDRGELSFTDYEEDLDRGMYCLSYIAKAIGRYDSVSHTTLCTIGNHVFHVEEDDVVNPAKAACLAGVKVIPFEYPTISSLYFDIDVESKEDMNQIIDSIVIDIATMSGYYCLLSYRGGKRYVERYDRLRPLPETEWKPVFKEKGIYLIAGGFGAMGFSMATYLAKTYHARCILIGRSEFPSREEWSTYHGENPKHAYFIQTMLELEKDGAEFLVVQADITNYDQLVDIKEQILERWGQPVDGIVHAAYVIDYKGPIQSRTKEMTVEVSTAKVEGMMNLDQVFNSPNLDFFLACSSLGNITPAVKAGEVGYCVGNEFVDAYAAYKKGKGEMFAAINWNDWSDIGMSIRAHHVTYAEKEILPSFDDRFASTPEEGVEAFRYIAHMGEPRVIIGRLDLSTWALKDVDLIYNLSSHEYKQTKKQEQPQIIVQSDSSLTDTEAKLLMIYQDVFQDDDIEVTDNFYDIGGDSLMAMTIIENIHASFNIKLPLDKFFNQPTIREVASSIESLNKKKFIMISKAESKEYYDLSPAQERMFITEQMYQDMDLITYNEPDLFTVHGSVDVERLEQAFIKVIDRHESLRTSYHIHNQKPVQKVHATFDFHVERMKATKDNVQEVIKTFIRPIKLDTAPLIRVGWIELGDNDNIMIIDKHHIACDGLSKDILFKDFLEAYQQKELPNRELQYVDFAEWYNKTYKWNMQEENEKFWLDLFQDGVPELHLPYDHERTANNMFKGAMLDFTLSVEQTETWKKVFSGLDTTQFNIMMAIYSLFLSKITGQHDFVIGSPVSGRWHKEAQSIIGMFVNMLSFRMQIDENITFLDYMKVQKENYAQVMNNRYYPFDLLVKKVVKKRNFLENPIFNVTLEQNIWNEDQIQQTLEGITIGSYTVPDDDIISRFDLSVLFGDKGNQLGFRFLYASELFDASTIERYKNVLLEVIDKILKNPEIKICDVIAADIPKLSRIRKHESEQVVHYEKASAHQERLWFIDGFETNKLYEGSPIYHNIPTYAVLDFVPDISLLEKTMNNVFNKYDALCTVVQTQSYKPVQVIAKPAKFNIQVKETEFDETSKEEILKFVYKEIETPFVLDQAPLIRSILYKNSNGHCVLLFVAHHIICDAMSLQLVLNEVVNAYQNHGMVEYDVDRLQYSDYSQWQASMSADTRKKFLDFWEKNLKDKVKPMEVYTDTKREDIHVYKPAVKMQTLPANITDKMNQRTFLKEIDVSTILMAGFETLLYLYTNSTNITIGTMLDNRSDSETETIVGPITSLLTVSLDVEENTTFKELVYATANYLKESLPYKEIPFEEVCTYINPKKDMSRTALFDILFRYSDRSDAQYQAEEMNLGLGKYDLNLLIERRNNSYDLTLVYNKLYFRKTTIDDMMNHFIVLLDELFTSPEKELASYPLIVGQEKDAVLRRQEATNAEYDTNIKLYEAFEQQVDRTPDKVALTFEERSYTYRELDQLTNGLAEYLMESKQVRVGENVALLMDNSEWLVITILSVLKCGACYVPINVENPENRIEYYVKDSESRVLITDQEIHLSLSQNQSVELVDIREYKKQPIRSTVRHEINMDQNAKAYIIYTSGTTGNPKGCMVSHRNVIRLILNKSLPFQLTNQDKWIMAHAYSFDFSVWEIFGSLLTGAELLIPKMEQVRDVEQLVRLVQEKEITVLNQTPDAFAVFILIEKKSGEPKLHHLRYVCFGGGKLEPYLLKDWIERYPLSQVAMCNLYGITETTVHTTYHYLTEQEITNENAISNIGGPLPETKVYLLNNQLQLVPRGVIGEIYVGGTGLSLGYQNRQELTEKVFIQSPFNPQEQLYRSGDLGRWITKDEIQYIGRKDRQVKVRGYRIELGEIERRLLECEGIRQVYVNQQEDTEKLCAYIVSDQEIVEEKLNIYLAKYLPGYMIPSYYIRIDKIALNKNNKVDNNALPKPKESYTSSNQLVLPRNETEEKITNILKDLLKIDNISVMDNYFDMGVDSLMLVYLNSRIYEELGVKLSLMELFKYTTISQLSDYISYNNSGYEFNEEKAKEMAEGVSNLIYITKRLEQDEEDDEL